MKKQKKIVTRYFQLAGTMLHCETQRGEDKLLCIIDLENGRFTLERTTFNLDDVHDEIGVYLAVCERLIADGVCK